jgi:hypothetical protein
MYHRDAEISDIVVILDKRFENNLQGAVDCLKSAGMEIRAADDDNSVIEGSIDAAKVPELQKLDCVDYVRTVFTYFADYPPGDPRDQDNEPREEDDE